MPLLVHHLKPFFFFILWIISFGKILFSTYTLTSSWCLNKLMLLKKLLECIFCSHNREYCVGHSMYISRNIYITAFWNPHAVKLRSCKLVFISCRITETSPACHSALRSGAKQHQFKANVLSCISIGSRREGWGDLSLQTNAEQLPKISHISQPCEDQSHSILGNIQQV